MKNSIHKFSTTVPSALLLALILTISFSSCSQPNLGDIVRKHIEAVNTDDVEKNLTFFTDDAVFEIGARTKLSGKDQLRSLMEADAANKARLTILDMKVEGRTVMARLTGKNEFLRLLGVEESPQRCTYKFRGRFFEKVTVEFLEGGGLFDEKYRLFAEWAGREHPQEFKRMEAGGYTAEGTRLGLSLMKEWRDKTSAESGSAEQELIQLENEWAGAWAKHDVAFFERIEADDYTWTSPSGEVWTKAKDLAFVKSLKAGKGAISSQVIAEMKVRAYGDVAVVTGRDIIKETHEGKEISRQERWTDTWVKLAGRWQCVAGHSSEVAQK
jgi:ketosteroid isomerase-like protein